MAKATVDEHGNGSGTGEVKEAFGQKFDPPIKFSYTWKNVQESELTAITDEKFRTELLESVNTVRQNSARQNAYQLAIAPIKPDTMTPEQRIELAVRNLVMAGVPEELARQSIAAMQTK